MPLRSGNVQSTERISYAYVPYPTLSQTGHFRDSSTCNILVHSSEIKDWDMVWQSILPLIYAVSLQFIYGALYVYGLFTDVYIIEFTLVNNYS